MDQHTGVGNKVGVFDLDFEVVNRFRGPAGGDTGDAGDAVQRLQLFAHGETVGPDEGFPSTLQIG
jgi:hypothetical protein